MPALKPIKKRRKFVVKIRDLLLGAILLSLVMSLAFTFTVSGRTLMQNELKERLRSLAATSSLLFDARDLAKLHTARDADLPVYEKTVLMLDAIRSQNPDIRFAYILRPTDDPTFFSFVADADSLHPSTPYDLNGDGVINNQDTQTPPGTAYDVTSTPAIPQALNGPSTTDKPYTDQWGTYMSGFAPIKDSSGKTVAVVGFDIDYTRFNDLVQSAFSPIVILLLITAGIAIAAYLITSVAWDRRRTKDRLEEERNMLLQLNAHQLGSPVTILQWSLETLKSIPESETNLAVAEQIDALEDVAHRLKTIMFAFHEAERIHSGTMEPEAKLTPVTDIVKNAEAETAKQILRRRQKLAVNLRTTASVMAEEKLITGVLAELLTNASDFSPEGAAITLDVVSEDKNVRIDVTDPGCGIPIKEQKNLFRAFVRASNAARQKPDGSGLGLYIARGVIERAGGEIVIRSAEGKGTTVSFTLPSAE